LLYGYTEAIAALYAAIEKVAQTVPNGRDYYVQEPGSFTVAQSEHCARIQRLLDVKAELDAIVEAIDQQGGERC
jgi:hypothetical protein